MNILIKYILKVKIINLSATQVLVNKNTQKELWPKSSEANMD